MSVALPAHATLLSVLRSKAYMSACRTFTSFSGPLYICGCHHWKKMPDGISFEFFLPSTCGRVATERSCRYWTSPERKFATCADSSARKRNVSSLEVGAAAVPVVGEALELEPVALDEVLVREGAGAEGVLAEVQVVGVLRHDEPEAEVLDHPRRLLRRDPELAVVDLDGLAPDVLGQGQEVVRGGLDRVVDAVEAPDDVLDPQRVAVVELDALADRHDRVLFVGVDHFVASSGTARPVLSYLTSVSYIAYAISWPQR